MRTLPIALFLAAACGGSQKSDTTTPTPTKGASLDIGLEAKSGATLTATATASEVDGGVEFVIKVTGATPGKHGVHVHEIPDCSAPDAKSAGPHFNPGGHQHGLPEGQRHIGDLGNLEVVEDGSGELRAIAPGASLGGSEGPSLVDRALVIHAKEDDGSDPSGNSGDRIACGVIRR
jgi:superoxide dismutase, Cu-Zn family